MDWQPIETAPKDGRGLRLRGRRYRSDTEEELDGFYESSYTEGWATQRGGWFYPTHWMPLPDTPP